MKRLSRKEIITSLDTGLELWQEDKKLLSSDTKNWKEDLALAEITL